MNSSKTQVIFFDATGTLMRVRGGVPHHYSVLAARHGIELEVPSLREAFVAAWRELPSPPVTHVPRPDDDRSWWHGLLLEILARLNRSVPESQFEPFFDELYTHFAKPGVWEAYPEVPAVLESLSGRFRLGVISNFDRRIYPVLEELGLRQFFDHVVVSSEVGADKPDPHIFQFALQKFGIRAGQGLHVGDHPAEDWEGAREMGLQVFELKRPANSLSDLLGLLQNG